MDKNKIETEEAKHGRILQERTVTAIVDDETYTVNLLRGRRHYSDAFLREIYPNARQWGGGGLR